MPRPPVYRALLLDVGDGSHVVETRSFPETIGPVDFGLEMWPHDRLCLGSGALAGSIVPGSNRLVLTGTSPVWGGFYVSTIGGAALLWDGLGVAFLAIQGRAAEPSVIVLSGGRDRDPAVRLVAVDLDRLWRGEEGGLPGFYALQRHVFHRLWDAPHTPRVLAVGPAARATAFGAIGSSKTRQGKITPIDCWAGRGGLGSRLLQRHNVCAVVYGGDFEDEDLSDRAEADGYFERRFSKKMMLVDLEKTTKYRYDPAFASGGTFGINYARLEELTLSFNYRSVSWPPEQRQALWERLVRDHYHRQFNEEVIAPKNHTNCGEPCPAVCKKFSGEFKKDYEPYQTMGPLSGIFDQRAAERVNQRADALGFDGIQIGGQIAWALECLHDGVVAPGDLGLPAGAPARPVFSPDGFSPVRDSETNASLALALLDLTVQPGHLLARGMRAAARALGPAARARAVYLANGPDGWMVPNQYWVPGMFGPSSLMGKYYVYYEFDWHPPRELGRLSAERMIAELETDNAGVCRFHRGWSESLWKDIVQGHFEVAVDYPDRHARLARLLHAQGRPVYWETERVEEIVHRYLREVRLTTRDDPALGEWLARFDADRGAAARAYWHEVKAGLDERLGAAGGAR